MRRWHSCSGATRARRGAEMADRPRQNASLALLASLAPAAALGSNVSTIVGHGKGTARSPEKLENAPLRPYTRYTCAKMVLCMPSLPSLESFDEHATIHSFTSPIFKDGLLCLSSPLALGVIRLSFASCMTVTRHLNAMVKRLGATGRWGLTGSRTSSVSGRSGETLFCTRCQCGRGAHCTSVHLGPGSSKANKRMSNYLHEGAPYGRRTAF